MDEICIMTVSSINKPLFLDEIRFIVIGLLEIWWNVVIFTPINRDLETKE